LKDLKAEHTELREFMKKLSLHLTSMLEAKNRESALALRRPVEAKGNIEKEATLLKAKHKNNGTLPSHQS
jgi:predicted Ser/Thr protein kinase